MATAIDNTAYDATEEVDDTDVRLPRVGRVAPSMPELLFRVFTALITPEKIKSAFNSANAGEFSVQNGLFDAVLERDGIIRSEYDRRVDSLSGLCYEIVPTLEENADEQPDDAMKRSIDHCRAELPDFSKLRKVFKHLAEAIGRGVSVAQIIWEVRGGGHKIAAIEPIDFAQVRGETTDPRRLRVMRPNDYVGIAIDESPYNFIVHAPRSIGGLPIRGALLKPAMFLNLCRAINKKAWGVGVEVFGNPTRTATYPNDATQEVIDAIMKMLRDMATDQAGAFPEGTTFALHARPSGGESIFTSWDTAINTEITRLFRGSTLTAQMDKSGGSFAAAGVHAEVTDEIRNSDIADEGETIRDQLLTAIVRLKFGPDAPVPYFRRVVEKPRDLQKMALLASTAVNDLGAPVKMSFVEDELGLPLVEGADPEAPLPGRAVAPNPLDLGGGLLPDEAGDAATDRETPADADQRQRRLQTNKRRLASNKLMDRILSGRSRLSVLAPWIIAAVLASQTPTEAAIATVREKLAQVDDVRDADLLGRFIAGHIDELPIEQLAELERQFILATELRGRFTALQRIERRQARRGAGRLRANAAEIRFEKLPFIEAIEALRERVGLTPEQFIALDRQARSRAFRVAGVYNMDLLADIHGELIEALATGQTVRDFRQRALAIEAPPGETTFAERRGWTGENPWHADIVHFQNTAMAYAAGSYRQLQEAGVPAWRFVANGEGSCPICEPEVGKAYPISDTARMPPLHFNCDCDHEPVFDEEVAAAEFAGAELSDSSSPKNPNVGLADERSRPSGFQFDVRQYGNVEPIDLGRYPPELRGAFERFAINRGWRFA